MAWTASRVLKRKRCETLLYVAVLTQMPNARLLLDYCETDVVALSKLLPAMLPKIDLPRALLRGRYMAAAAKIEWDGIPIDVDTLSVLRSNWSAIQDQLIVSIDRNYGIYDGRAFKTKRFEAWLKMKDIAWPRLSTGNLDLSEDTFHQMARSHAEIAPISELRHSLSRLRLSDMAVGSDGRNRCLLSAFAARLAETSRATASSSLDLRSGCGD